MAKHIILLSLVALSFGFLAFAFEPSPLQDFCVADSTKWAAPAWKHIEPQWLKRSPSVCSPAGLNTLGISMVRIDYAPWESTLHTHPRATEILTVLEVDLFTSSTTWETGNAVAIAALSSQNPGVITIANAVFGSKPDVSSDILAKAFQWAAPAWKHIEPQWLKVTPVSVAQLPGLNTLGISMVRIDYAPWGINPPHTHPRATEILTVLEGSLQVGFVTSNPDNSLITKTLQKGDVFVFPVGLIHFQRNVGSGNAVAIAALSSQNPGVITIANAVFGSKPGISSDILAKAFQVDKSVVYQLQAKF
ncbi:UNVERIFIED_CONTAM: putative germin-like protein 2-2 [Sesamum calycinum]|uniref:Germin-like protein 2-2 n=1 Tax=Sesamum calycinum TaxID=2727403 RepID=A0AAW2RTZ0_9LAMI